MKINECSSEGKCDTIVSQSNFQFVETYSSEVERIRPHFPYGCTRPHARVHVRNIHFI